MPGAKVRRDPTVVEIARASGVGTATVDRVLNGRDAVRDATRSKVLAALARLRGAETPISAPTTHRIGFLSDSGTSFNKTLEQAVRAHAAAHGGIECPFTSVTTSQVNPIKLANLIERTAESVQALVIVAREDPIINRAIRNVIARHVPVVCITTDLPTSGRLAYIGSDQTSAGATAAYLMGQVVGSRPGKILLIYSAPYRTQEDRELGFRRVLRSEFPRLVVDERVSSNDDTDWVYRNVMKYIDEHGAPAGLYNLAAGNLGVGRALTDAGLAGKVLFIGHELNPNSRMLLETGVMNFAIGHDVQIEVAEAISFLTAHLEKKSPAVPPLSQVRIYTK